MQIYEGLVKGLESIGVDTAFGWQQGNIASLTVALKNSAIRPIATRHEQGIRAVDGGRPSRWPRILATLARFTSPKFPLAAGS